MSNNLLGLAFWAVPLLVAAAWIWHRVSMSRQPQCPACGCRAYEDELIRTTPHIHSVIVLHKRFACGYGCDERGRPTLPCGSTRLLRKIA